MITDDKAAWEQIQKYNSAAKSGAIIQFFGIPFIVLTPLLALTKVDSSVCISMLTAGLLVILIGMLIKHNGIIKVNTILWDTLHEFVEATYRDKIGKREDLSRDEFEQYKESLLSTNLVGGFNTILTSNERRVYFKNSKITAANIRLINEQIDEESKDGSPVKNTVFIGIWAFIDTEKYDIGWGEKELSCNRLGKLTDGEAFIKIFDGKIHLVIKTDHAIADYNKTTSEEVTDMDSLKGAIADEIVYERNIYDELSKL